MIKQELKAEGDESAKLVAVRQETSSLNPCVLIKCANKPQGSLTDRSENFNANFAFEEIEFLWKKIP